MISTLHRTPRVSGFIRFGSGRLARVTTWLLFVLTMICGRVVSAEDTPPGVSYERQIRPIFQAHCQGCHQPAKASGEYVMTSFAQLVDGGESGRPAIVPNAADESYLVELITVHDGESEMPKNAPPLSEAEIDLIKQWISSGAANDSSDSARPAFDQDNPPHYIRPPIVTAMDVSPDGSLIAISGFHEVLVHRTDGTGLVARLIGMSERIESLRFSLFHIP